MQQVLVKIWDDVDHAAGRNTDAEVVTYLELNGKRRRLDLTKAHEAELEALLEPWLAAGQDLSESAAQRRRFSAGSKESRDFYFALRQWADSVGRSDEYKVRHKPGSARKINYHYPDKLVADFEDHLNTLAAA